MTQKRKSQLNLFLVAIFWGLGYVVTDVALDYYSTNSILLLRFTIAFLLLLLIFRKELQHMTRNVLVKGGFMGLILYLAYFFQTFGLSMTTPSKNAFLTSTNVVLVPFIAFVFFGRGLARTSILGAIVTFLGIGLISFEGFDFSTINMGDLLTLVSAILFALQIIYTNRFVKKENIFLLNTVQMGAAGLVAGIVHLMMGEPLVFTSSVGNLSILYLGAVNTMVAFMLQTLAQRYTTETETVVILSLEAVFGMVFSYFLLQEVITLQMLWGATLILAGVIVVQIKPKTIRQKKEKEQI